MLNIERFFGRLIKQQNWHVADNRPAAAHAIRVTFMALDEGPPYILHHAVTDLNVD